MGARERWYNHNPKKPFTARKIYTEEFKIAGAKLFHEQGYTVKKDARSLGVELGPPHRSSHGRSDRRRLALGA